jgi:hypothetical protein
MNLNFDATNIEPQAPLDAVPVGVYPVKIKWTEKKETKNPGSFYLQMQLEIIDGNYKGRQVFDRLNLWNANAQAVEIAQRTLATICHAVGMLKVKNHEEFRGKTLQAKLSIRSDEKYGDSNEVKAYAKLEGYTAPVASAEQAPASDETPPWARK